MSVREGETLHIQALVAKLTVESFDVAIVDPSRPSEAELHAALNEILMKWSAFTRSPETQRRAYGGKIGIKLKHRSPICTFAAEQPLE
jgi:hypothetical protein